MKVAAQTIEIIPIENVIPNAYRKSVINNCTATATPGKSPKVVSTKVSPRICLAIDDECAPTAPLNPISELLCDILYDITPETPRNIFIRRKIKTINANASWI